MFEKNWLWYVKFLRCLLKNFNFSWNSRSYEGIKFKQENLFEKICVQPMTLNSDLLWLFGKKILGLGLYRLNENPPSCWLKPVKYFFSQIHY